MLRAFHNACRVLLASMAFTMAFFLTPRFWVENAEAPSSRQVPIDALEQPNSCLWCDEPVSRPRCDDPDDENSVWLNPDSVRNNADEPCDNDRPGSKPNA